jgi:bifunctional NMN adenylyltransferase/nudix hydrolase
MQHEYLVNYRKQYGEGPFLTADTLVQVGGKILLIRRGKEYGHGLLALPGGFVNKHETFLDAALRELREETRLRVPVPVLQGSIRNRVTFDDPHRSARARLVTQCFHVLLANDTKLPEVRGGDDADEALWMDVADLREEDFFEDHYHIIKSMLGIS